MQLSVGVKTSLGKHIIFHVNNDAVSRGINKHSIKIGHHHVAAQVFISLVCHLISLFLLSGFPLLIMRLLTLPLDFFCIYVQTRPSSAPEAILEVLRIGGITTHQWPKAIAFYLWHGLAPTLNASIQLGSANSSLRPTLQPLQC